MRLVLSSIFILILFVSAYAALLRVEDKSPGSLGMATNIDVGQMPKGTSTYMVNFENTEHRGALTRRSGFVAFGSVNSKALSAAHAIFDAPKKYKALVGIGHDASVPTGKHDPTAGAGGGVDGTRAFTDSSLGQFVRTELRNEAVTINMSNWFVGYRPDDQNFVHTDDYLIYVDGSSTPVSIALAGLFTNNFGSLNDSVDGLAVDTVNFFPNLKPLSLEPPGVLRPFALNSNIAGLTGIFQYATAFYINDTLASTNDTLVGLANDSVGPLSLPTIEIFVDSGMVALTNFPVYPYILDRKDDSVAVKIFRRNILKDVGDEWYVLDSIVYLPSDEVVYLDSISEPLAIIWPDSTINSFSELIPAPGALWKWRRGDTLTVLAADTTRAWVPEAVYYFKYSYYDPIRNIESPLGPAVKCSTRAIFNTDDQEVGLLSWPYYGWENHAKYMRIYQTVNEVGLLGSGDSLIWYLFAEVDLDSLNNRNGVNFDRNEIPVGILNDSVIADPASVLPLDPFGLNAFPDGFKFGTYFTKNRKYEFPILSEAGGAIIQPPFIGQLLSPFIDMEFANGRMWGVGDAQFPSRVYYSEFEEFGDWRGFSFLQLGAGDGEAITSIERVPLEEGDGLVIFKPSSTHGIIGYDPEFDLSIITIDNEVGAYRSDWVVRHGNDIYFADDDYTIYRMHGLSKPVPISSAIRSQVITLFRDSLDVDVPPPSGSPKGGPQRGGDAEEPITAASIKAMKFDEYVMWVNQPDGRTLVFNTLTETWFMNQYSFFDDRPRGIVDYDTTDNIRLNANINHLFYTDGQDTTMARQEDSAFHDVGVGGYSVYRSQFFGDGVHVFAIDHIDFTLSSWDESGGATATLFILTYNLLGDTLSVDTLNVAQTTSDRGYRVGVPMNIARYLQFELAVDTIVGSNFRFHEYSVSLINMGIPHDQ